MKDDLIKKIESNDFVIGVIGLGYVGLPLLFTFAENGYPCIGFDVDEEKVRMLNRGRSYIRHVSTERVRKAALSGRIRATTDSSDLKACDGIIIAVPTPLTINREPDMSYVVGTCQAISLHLRKGQIIILESTTYPGTVEEVMVPILEHSGLKLDRDYFVAYSPEREDPNNQSFSIATIPKVVGSTSSEGLEVAVKLYKKVVAVTVPVSSVRVAEATKLLENIFRAVNIALVNELKMTFMKMGIDIWEVIEAASTKPFGYMPFYPGPGLGGHCIPVDPFYLTWKAREYGMYTKFIELAGEINTSMPNFVITRVMEALNYHGKPLRKAKILILGLAYKPNVDDDRESPSYYLMDELERRGAIVSYNDPFIPVIKPSRLFSKYSGRKSSPISNNYDIILISTAHDEYKTIDFHKFNIPVVDTRNILKGESSLFYRA